MARLALTLLVTLGLACLLVSAALPAPRQEGAAKLEEIRVLMAENNRIQRIDVHRKLFRHALLPACTLGDDCLALEGRMQLHDMGRFTHAFQPSCDGGERCKARDVEAAKKLREFQDQKGK